MVNRIFICQQEEIKKGQAGLLAMSDEAGLLAMSYEADNIGRIDVDLESCIRYTLCLCSSGLEHTSVRQVHMPPTPSRSHFPRFTSVHPSLSRPLNSFVALSPNT